MESENFGERCTQDVAHGHAKKMLMFYQKMTEVKVYWGQTDDTWKSELGR